MKHYLPLATLFFVATTASGRSVDVCPKLPDGYGLEWKYHEGPDFNVCYAVEANSKADVFGIYLGNAPSFDPDRKNRIGKGRVAEQKVIWYRLYAEDNKTILGRQTLMVLDKKYDYVAHIWLGAVTPQELQRKLSILERITFKP